MLLKASLSLSPNNPLRKWTYHGLLGLLAVSGLRLTEVLSLRLSDVDLQNAVLTVRGTKFGKCRLVPLHDSTRRVLSRYKSRRDQYLKGQPASDFFFITQRGTRLEKNNVRRTFHALSRQMGLRGEFGSQTSPARLSSSIRDSDTFALVSLRRRCRAASSGSFHLSRT